MECKNCKTDVPSIFEYALSKNVCPKCGNKLMADMAMKVYIDLKNRLGEVEFVMDKAVVCERVAMFVVSNYEIIPLKINEHKQVVSRQTAEIIKQKDPIDEFIAAEENGEVEDISIEDMRRAEARRAEMAMNSEIDVDEEMISGNSGLIDENRVQRLKALAASGNKSGPSVRRVS